jgi:thioredoxin 1
MATPIKVESGSWDQEILKAPGLVMVDFWAVWCGPCRMVAPIVDELAQEYDGKVKVAKLNTDDNPDIAARYQIMGIPTLLFFRNGQPVDKIVGAAAKKHFKEKIEALLARA